MDPTMQHTLQYLFAKRSISSELVRGETYEEETILDTCCTAHHDPCNYNRLRGRRGKPERRLRYLWLAAHPERNRNRLDWLCSRRYDHPAGVRRSTKCHLH